MKGPTLSVFLPNYNNANLIGRAIEAIVSQSRLPDEFIILEDGSTDNSIEVIESYIKRYPHIRLVRNRENTGLMAMQQYLIGMNSSDYLYIAASDDYVLPGFFEKAMDMTRRYPEAGVIFGKMVVAGSKGEELNLCEVTRWQKPLFASPDVFLREYINVEFAGHSACTATIYRKRALEEVGGFRKELGHWNDTFAVRAIALKYGACYLATRCAVWRVMLDSLSQSTQRNPKRGLDVVARAAWLMRSPEFRDRFPEEHVSRWEKGYREGIINDYMQRCGRLWAWSVKMVLNRYKGDISCYHVQLHRDK